jgi:aminopeptidase YwaD
VLAIKARETRRVSRGTGDRMGVARMMADLYTLSDTVFAGRRVGSPGHERARDWVAGRLEALGFVVTLASSKTAIDVLDCVETPQVALGSYELRYRRDFAEHPRSAALRQSVEAPVRQLGDPNSQGAWIALQTVPRGAELAELAHVLAAQGAVGLLTPQTGSEHGYLFKRISGEAVGLPIVAIETSVLASVAGKQLRVRLPLQRFRPTIANLVASLPHRDGQGLLIGAHYDGMGDDPGGERLPGASDNASGLAVILEVARQLAQRRERLKQPLSLVAFDGEEVNAAGSRALAAQFVAAQQRPLVLNLDGAARISETVAVEPSGPAKKLIAALDATGRQHGISLRVASVASDNRAFANAGFGAIGVGFGLAAMHTPADTPDRVDPNALRLAAQLVLGSAWRVLSQEPAT